ncbi:MAG: sugar ABC transporter ATP-binding protein [Microbacteriaceae bacterium]|nr:sugar ABC transporter ATP-binding protein [Microbacteriaceae bacterium]
MPSEATTPLLRVTGLRKVFPGLTALDHVNLDVRPGEIVSVVGHNGSGKSTLIKILAGVYTADGGSVETAPGTELHFIHQDLGLIGELTAAENLALMRGEGTESLAPYGAKARSERARELTTRFGIPFDVDIPVQKLTPAQRAIVAISRALDGWSHSANVLFLDEPTESLHRSEVEVLFDAVRALAAEGTGIVFVSHRLNEVLSLSDRIVVLRDGKKVADDPIDDIDETKLVQYITGTDTHESHDRVSTATDEVVLDVRALRGGNVERIDLTLRRGEIVGIAGVLGSGRETVPSLLFGAEPSTAEQFEVAGAPYAKRSPSASLKRGIVFTPGDRARLGVVREMNARENLTLPHLNLLRGALGYMSPRAERTRASEAMVDYDVKPSRSEQRISLFSGGNQQKLVIARALHDQPRELLLDDPTKGVDLGAKAAIYQAFSRGAADGAAVVVSSSDAKELLGICDRVIVMRDGEAVLDLGGDELTEERLLAAGYGLP